MIKIFCSGKGRSGLSIHRTCPWCFFLLGRDREQVKEKDMQKGSISWTRENESMYDACLRWASKWGSLTEWRDCHRSSYNTASAHGWTKIIAKKLKWKHNGDWFDIGLSKYDSCYLIAKSFPSKSKWRDRHRNSYQYAVKKKWLEEISAKAF